MPKTVSAAELMKRVEAGEVERIAAWLAEHPLGGADLDAAVAGLAAWRAQRWIRQLERRPYLVAPVTRSRR